VARRAPLLFSVLGALLATSIGSVLLPLGLSGSGDSMLVGVALNLWAILLAPSSLFIALLFWPDFARANFHLVMALGFVVNVLIWTGVLYGGSLLVAKSRRRPARTPADPA